MTQKPLLLCGKAISQIVKLYLIGYNSGKLVGFMPYRVYMSNVSAPEMHLDKKILGDLAQQYMEIWDNQARILT
jgi:ribosomal protein L20